MNATPESDALYERFQLIINGPALFNAVVTGLELDVFRFLAQRPGASRDEIQAFTGAKAHQLRVLMFALCTTGLIRRDGDGGYVNSALAETSLAPHGPDSWRDILVGWKTLYYPAFAHLTASVREGTNTAALSAFSGTEPTLYQRLGHHPEHEAVLHRSMSAFSLRSLPGLLDNADLAGVDRLLDVGGGDGTTARELTARHPHLHVTVFDLSSVTDLARDGDGGGKREDEGEERVHLHPADLFDDPFPAGFGAVLFSHVLEVFSDEQILRLLEKAVKALPSGGKIFIYGFNAADGEQSGLLSARLSLYLNVLATGQGMAYPAEDYEVWLRRAGCADVKSITGLPFEHGLTIGTKA
jgi:O-methyltransferase domain